MSNPEPSDRVEVLPVGLGEFRVARNSPAMLVCYGLGSCVGVAAWDPVAGVGGMAHVVLPDSALGHHLEPPGKFADTAVPRLLREMLAAGALQSRLLIKLGGGARMLLRSDRGDRLDIGQRNAEAVLRAVEAAGLRVAGQDLGGNHGRTMQLHLPGGRVTVSTIGRGEKEL